MTLQCRYNSWNSVVTLELTQRNLIMRQNGTSVPVNAKIKAPSQHQNPHCGKALLEVATLHTKFRRRIYLFLSSLFGIIGCPVRPSPRLLVFHISFFYKYIRNIPSTFFPQFSCARLSAIASPLLFHQLMFHVRPLSHSHHPRQLNSYATAPATELTSPHFSLRSNFTAVNPLVLFTVNYVAYSAHGIRWGF